MPDPNDFIAEFLDRVGNILGKLSLIDKPLGTIGISPLSRVWKEAE